MYSSHPTVLASAHWLQNGQDNPHPLIFIGHKPPPFLAISLHPFARAFANIFTPDSAKLAVTGPAFSAFCHIFPSSHLVHASSPMKTPAQSVRLHIYQLASACASRSICGMWRTRLKSCFVSTPTRICSRCVDVSRPTGHRQPNLFSLSKAIGPP